MKFKTKTFIDRFIGRILCFCFGAAALLFGKILRRDHSITMDNVRHIAVAKYFGIGSITHAGPMLKALKNKYPSAKLIFITRKNNKEFLELISYIDESYFMDDSSFISFFVSNIRLLLKLQSLKIDLFFDLEVFSTYGALIGLFSLTRNRFGFFFPHTANFKTWIYSHLMYFNFRMPLRLMYMQLACLGGGAGINSSTELLPFNIDETSRRLAKEKLENLVQKQKSQVVLLINANASELSYSRRWHIENFAKTAKHFADLGYVVLFLGSSNEKDYVQKALNYIETNYQTTKNIYNAAGIFTIKEIPALFDICDILLTNDAGLMNLGYAQGIKTVSLYGANAPSFVHIDNGRNTAIYKKAYCSPCLYLFDIPPCGDLAVCIKSITVDEVIKSVEDALSKTNSVYPGVYTDKKDCIVVNKEHDYIMGTLRKK